MRLALLGGALVLVSATPFALELANRVSEEDASAYLVAGQSVSPGLQRLRERARVDPLLFADNPVEPTFGTDHMLVSQLCTQSQFASPALARWAAELKEEVRFHCKVWEYAYILQALSERGMLKAGRKGLGFGVGQEPIPSVIAKHGAQVLATDLDLEQATELGWVKSNEYMSSIEILNKRGIAPEKDFHRLVRARNVDMNGIPRDLRGFDFTWSTCALGHLGNLEKGLAFIENSLETLKPGGIAVHTTEFNLTSDTDTMETENTSVYRRRDIEQLVQRLRAQGHEVSVNFNTGSGPLDQRVVEQLGDTDKRLRFRLYGYAVTSIGIVIRKNPRAMQKRAGA